ncbi:cyclin-T isoform X2 [Bombyx mandarina]|uniref:Cyclin-T isoform X2 n=1 Tax=Bombyx mandarina TaxID=7092 RepID=A0A6J2JWB0_BOMMA|nr:cyclin-T isoform X2 [Bombyx mandarina]
MAGGQEKWYFTKEQLQNSPSRKCGLDADKELAYRQQAANLIQDMGQRLQVSQLCINTAIVYMHRFYAFHSFTQFHRNAIAAAALFLAAKVEEQPRKLEYVIKVAHVCLHRGEGVNALTPEQYQEQAQDLVFNENVLLQTLGFDVAIDHPHTHVVRTCHLVKATKDLAQTSYFMASNSLHLTTMCLQYKPTVVACFCIHLASKWSNWVIPQSYEGRHWFSYVDKTVTMELLEKLTGEFLLIFEKCPSRLKRKMMNVKAADGSSPASLPQHGSGANQASPFDKKHGQHSSTSDEIDKSFDKEYERERRRQPVPGSYVPAPSAAPPAQPPPQKLDYNQYREKREREERERREEKARREQLHQQRPNAPQQRPSQPPPHHQRPHHHKPHHPWPPQKPHQQKPPHEHNRHHRPMPAPSTSASGSASASSSQSVQEIPQRTRPPSLFSPENATTPTAAAAAAPRRPQPQPQPQPQIQPQPQSQHPPTQPPQSQPPRPKHEPRHNPPPVLIQEQRPPSPRKRPDPSAAIKEMQPPAILSPFSSPPSIEQPKPRQRQHSNSEPELVPVMKKIDETPGYENIMKENQRIIKNKVSERKPEPPPRALNGIETDPTLVSNLLKESLAKPVPISVPTEKKSPIEVKREVVEPPPPPAPVQAQPELIQPPDQADQKHKKDKKKKEKHKHKDRDKSKEERKKHKKDKEKEKKKDSPPPVETQDGTLRITIPRDKLSTSPGQGLKIKIPKERLAAPPPPPQHPPPQAGLKIKISKEVLESSRKRAAPPEPGLPSKLPRHNGAPHHKVVESAMGNGHSGK